jgi:hypothetical protein
MIEEIKKEVAVNRRFKSMARGDGPAIDQDLKQMIGDLPSILSNDSSKSNCNSSNYSVPEVQEGEEDLVTGSQFSNFILSSGGINAICGSADR